MRIYCRADRRAHVSVTRPAQKHKNAKTVQIHKNETDNDKTMMMMMMMMMMIIRKVKNQSVSEPILLI